MLPYVPDAWVDHTKTKIGYEIPLTRHFYRYVPPRPLAEIDAEIRQLEDEIQELLERGDAVSGVVHASDAGQRTVGDRRRRRRSRDGAGDAVRARATDIDARRYMVDRRSGELRVREPHGVSVASA